MKLKVSGNINEYYVQTLCMIFFPGEKFSQKASDDEEDGVAVPELSLELFENDFSASADESDFAGADISRVQDYPS